MRSFPVLFIALFCLTRATAQTQADTTIHAADSVLFSKEGVFRRVEIESEFPGGGRAWLQFLNDHLQYPKKAIRKYIQGTVLLQFIVDTDGSISDLQVISGDPLLGKAAMDAMKYSPKWRPAIQHGRGVKSYKKQPIIFRLE